MGRTKPPAKRACFWLLPFLNGPTTCSIFIVFFCVCIKCSDDERAALAAQLVGHKREYASLRAALKDAALAQRAAALRSAQARAAHAFAPRLGPYIL